jgi:hypothetical protein
MYELLAKSSDWIILLCFLRLIGSELPLVILLGEEEFTPTYPKS